MIEVHVLIPAADNSGLPFDAAHHAAFELRACELFGGVTRLPSEAAGAWVDAGVVYRDAMRVYLVGLSSIVDGAKVGELATFAKGHYRQLAIYVRYLGLSEIL